jgi:ketosteroid isomerase-like protein
MAHRSELAESSTRNRVTRLGALVLAAAFAAGCGAIMRQSQPTPASEIETIREAREAQNRAIVERDIEAIAELLEPDIHATSGVGIHFVGRDAYRRAYEDDFEALEGVIYTRTPDVIELSSVDTGLAERVAAESGTWTGTWAERRGPVRMEGVYSAMWRKRSGRWRINSEIFVSLRCSGGGCP